MKEIINDPEILERHIALEWDMNSETRERELAQKVDETYFCEIIPTVKDLIVKNFDGGSILDVGSGHGVLTKEIFDLREQLNLNRIIGVDISSLSIRKAQSRCPGVEFLNDSIIELYNDGLLYKNRFSLIVANMVLHNVPNLRSHLRAMNFMLQENGKLIFSIPHPMNWIKKHSQITVDSLDDEGCKYSKLPFKIMKGHVHPSHITYFLRSVNNYIDALAEGGFVIEEDCVNQRHNPRTKGNIWFVVARKRSH
jgi:2-polyprenyl-3-methyl-5-hydroxy-6-metoxy-1,4-benzoquinol methylase